MAVINWTHRSVNDLRNIAEFIEKDSVKYASLTIQRLLNAAQLLEVTLELGAKYQRLVTRTKFEKSFKATTESFIRLLMKI